MQKTLEIRGGEKYTKIHKIGGNATEISKLYKIKKTGEKKHLKKGKKGGNRK